VKLVTPAIPFSRSTRRGDVKRLALFWFVCAAAGFAAAAGAAVLLSAAFDGGGLRLTATQAAVHALEMRPTPSNAARDPRDVGHDRLLPW
jgi:hypothetical protein